MCQEFRLLSLEVLATLIVRLNGSIEAAFLISSAPIPVHRGTKAPALRPRDAQDAGDTSPSRPCFGEFSLLHQSTGMEPGNATKNVAPASGFASAHTWPP